MALAKHWLLGTPDCGSDLMYMRMACAHPFLGVPDHVMLSVHGSDTTIVGGGAVCGRKRFLPVDCLTEVG